ncbi:tRNA (uracil-5-)-methyltransferase [Lachnoclostridium sp. An169]|uniref:tRNA (uracil-5-)-methyltransferase n=1 Tax=Lachnoclostridium sp. An169 TaxID=1965569 RepID=UPI000B397F35|nr:tRNA (uracil-5-)-methyltransferase [Lachnoclostridium sp. An169]OUP81319.1 tRNA (uracil-5-)-methyltransferase [Lachnoclostridium sp. An169]
MNKTAKNILLILLAVVLVVGGVFVGMNWNHWFGDEPADTAELDANAEDYTGDRDVYQGEKNTDTIDIPGFEAINLQAGTTEQSVNLYNPEQNTCYFRMSLLLADGTELWKSGLVEPGKAIYHITLNQTLEAGEYENAILKYECFVMNDEQTPLNGSEIKLTLNVLE